MTALQVFTNQTSDGTSSVFALNGSTRIKVSGDLDGGIVTLESKSNNLNDVFSTTGSINDITDTRREVVVTAQQGWSYQLVLNGATSPNINAFVSD